MRYLCLTSYKGTNYCGWQSQTVSKLPSIEQTIEAVISRVLNTNIKIYGSGRTDAGVHALAQAFHFDSPKALDEDKFVHSLNELLPKDIRLLSMKQVSDHFHARFNAVGKTYIYKINNSKTNDAFSSDLEYTLSQKLDVRKMVECSKIFLGEHNFQNFTSKDEDEQKFSRNIGDFTINSNKNHIEISLTGNGFMRYMVRMIVGNLIQVGLGKLSLEEVKKELENEVRKPSSHKAPAHGLYLKEVIYKD